MQQLPELLTALTEELVQIRDGGYTAGAFNGAGLEGTEDKDFIYLEAELACESTAEIDISVHDTRAFIRIVRSLTGPDSGDEVATDSKAIFGWVEFTEQEVTLRAALHKDGIWTCTAAPDVALLLNSGYAPAGDLSEIASWCDALIKATNRLGGLAWLVPDSLSDE